MVRPAPLPALHRQAEHGGADAQRVDARAGCSPGAAHRQCGSERTRILDQRIRITQVVVERRAEGLIRRTRDMADPPGPMSEPARIKIRRRPDADEFRAALGTIVSASAAPYGYTISLWSSGALLVRLHGLPTVAEIFLFLTGALVGFAVVGSLAHGALRTTMPLSPGQGHVLTGLLHWFSVGLAVGSVALVAEVPGWIAWPLGSVIATSVYLLASSLQLAAVTARASRHIRS